MTACDHLVQFYDTDDQLVNAVVPFLAAGFEADETVVVVATEAHRLEFERELAVLGQRLGEARAAGAYVAVDATEVLDYLQGDGEISPVDFDATIGMLVRRQLAKGRPLRAYGEIVGLLWDRGEVSRAVALEGMWNDLQRQNPFTLFCGYPVLTDAAQLGAIEQVCRAHSFVLPAVSELAQPPDTAALAEFAPSIEAPRRVRALLRAKLGELQFGEDLIERLTLAASELAANAVLHARTPFRLLVELKGSSVWIAVEDHEPLRSPLDVVGRTPHGLGLIAALAMRWGVAPAAAGKIVWAEIPQ